MKVLMFGWEFPPFSKGGLGTACHGLTKGLRNNNVDVTFVLPKAPNGTYSDHVRLIGADNFYMEDEASGYGAMKIYEIPSFLVQYITPEEYAKKRMTSAEYIKMNAHKIRQNSSRSDDADPYGKNLYAEVLRYADKAKLIAAVENFDVIHAHDWMTYSAGIEAKRISGKPLVVHVHATEFDRSGGNGYNPFVYDIERRGMHEADKVITVSQLTKDRVVASYGIPPEKVHVVHNAVDFDTVKFNKDEVKVDADEKVVLFLGRVTLQKGPEYFLYSAKQIIDMMPDQKVKFVFAGTGDMQEEMINLAAQLGISKNVIFTGWVSGPEIDKLYSMADLYVMPSVSEPFGITPLESMRNGTPVLISKQSGVAEVVKHALKVDFWDVDEMTNKIHSVLQYPALHKTLQQYGSDEVLTFSWDDPAAKCADVYNMAVSEHAKYNTLTGTIGNDYWS